MEKRVFRSEVGFLSLLVGMFMVVFIGSFCIEHKASKIEMINIEFFVSV